MMIYQVPSNSTNERTLIVSSLGSPGPRLDSPPKLSFISSRHSVKTRRIAREPGLLKRDL